MAGVFRAPLVLALLGGCAGAAPGGGSVLSPPVDTQGEVPADSPPAETDADGDGYDVSTDCDDDDASVYPGAPETPYDGVDQDCDGVDLDDVDGDGSLALGHGGGDCDDTRADVHPGATEVCNDGVDEDCDADPADCPFGGTGGVDELAAAFVTGGGILGTGVALPGDLDGDGQGDLAAAGWAGDGDPFTDTVWVLAGPLAGAVSADDAAAVLSLWDEDVKGSSGYVEVGGAGDVDGDGVPDLAVSAPFATVPPYNDAGEAFVFRGPFDGDRDASDAWLVVHGSSDEVYVGFAPPILADLDGDGVTDLVLDAAYGQDAAKGGQLSVWYGPLPSGRRAFGEADAVITSEVEGASFGFGVTLVDQDGDGLPELFAAEPGMDRALIFAGPFAGALETADAIASIQAPAGSGPFAVAALGDRNGDDRPELVLASAYFPIDGGTGGRVWVFDSPVEGARSVEDANATIGSDGEWRTFGYSAANAGDVDGDGLDDLAIGAPYAGEARNEGALFVYTQILEGASDADQATALAIGTSSGNYLGWTIAGGQDVTGDATSDVAAGWGVTVVAGNGT